VNRAALCALAMHHCAHSARACACCYCCAPAQAVSPIRLYGQYNTSTQSWEDGVLTKALRSVNGYDATNRAWVVSRVGEKRMNTVCSS